MSTEKPTKEAYADRCRCGHPMFKHTGVEGLNTDGCTLCMCKAPEKQPAPDTRETRPEKLG